jgi:hypothetical protein
MPFSESIIERGKNAAPFARRIASLNTSPRISGDHLAIAALADRCRPSCEIAQPRLSLEFACGCADHFIRLACCRRS